MYAELPEMQFLLVILNTTDDNNWDVGKKAATSKLGEQLCTTDTRHTRIGHYGIGEKSLAELAQSFDAVSHPYHFELFGKKSPNNLAKAVVGFH